MMTTTDYSNMSVQQIAVLNRDIPSMSARWHFARALKFADEGDFDRSENAFRMALVEEEFG